MKWDFDKMGFSATFWAKFRENMFLIFKFCKMKIQIFYEKVVSFDKTQ